MRTLSIRSLVFATLMLVMQVTSSARIFFSIGIAPPPLPVYVQPLCPGEGYIWTPGYWIYGDEGYFWVPGTWVSVPEPGLLWTPGYWGWGDGVYVFHEGYWGPRVGFYGGINYGFGYTGFGYEGGYWRDGAFFYNRSVNHVTNVRNVYNQRVVVNNTTVRNVSYNGGQGGVTARPRTQEEAAARERHIAPTSIQTQHVQAASTNRRLYESVNRGKPAVAATARPAEFSGRGVVAAKAAPSYRPPTARSATPARGANAASPSVSGAHPRDLSPAARPSTPSTGNPRLDRKYQQQQQSQGVRQDRERQKLQQRQEQEHRRLPQGNAAQARQQQVEQRHQQQTQQQAQRHAAQQQTLQSRQQPTGRKPPKQ